MSEAFQSLSFWLVAVASGVFFRALSPLISRTLSKALLIAISVALIVVFFGGRNYLLPLFIWVSISVVAAGVLRTVPISAKNGLYAVAVLIIVGALIVLKYPFYVRILSANLISSSVLGWVGLSYLAFRTIDLLSQARSRRMRSRSPLDAISYLLFFPSFVAGPINRFAPFSREISSAASTLTGEEMRGVVFRISFGIIKVIFLAKLALYNSILHFPFDERDPTVAEIVIGLYAYYFYIYFDFSGYTDMMVGLSRLFGVRLPENFNFPFLATSIQDFWNRWHISLSHWFRDHVFFPGFRHLSSIVPGIPAAAIAIFFTFVLVGAWHGDSWNWIFYGAYHGFGLACWSLWSQSWREWRPDYYDRLVALPTYRVVCCVLTFNYIALGLALTLDRTATDSFMRVAGL